ncbi:DUF2309 domain-containing protein [Mucilaginibacter sp. RB4R14]|uniref:DUF2309 domain-containing protein n=1 Tax=Mucilaginibacter aurantiaciroseus TaxID=2949308 RepID=UPI0020909906|nr:DUF2309 domain-containing protein [Mucilaginibacter aurantiaciroseus]MCO5936505.1 DUF2309 domain-containing protein [Mucilaginibacter aurantiaciroseus]
MINSDFNAEIEEASSVIGKTWPLYGFVTSNPLSGYEGLSFGDAIQKAKKYFGGSVLPTASMFQQAWSCGEIKDDILKEILTEAGLYQQAEFYLKEMDMAGDSHPIKGNPKLDRIMAKWLGMFMDEGMAEWEMPGRSEGFFVCWRRLAIYDQEIGIITGNKIPETAEQALSASLQSYSPKECVSIFGHHLAALPGWTGYIKYRMQEGSLWQQKYPITLKEYLAVRMWIAGQINTEIHTIKPVDHHETDLFSLQLLWLRAWEKSWQKGLGKAISENLIHLKSVPFIKKNLLAQFVFCIDTRSELIRRHIEAKGDYETFGYAGFFGLAADYRDPASGLVRKSCPPILSSAYTISEVPLPGKASDMAQYLKRKNYQKFADFLGQRMKNMLPSAFGYVEGTGLFYGLALLRRSIFGTRQFNGKTTHENSCTTQMGYHGDEKINSEIELIEKVAIVKSAFELLGWRNFAPLVIFAGHGSQSVNNPFASSLDCGACAASPGRHNARMLAALANLPEVRSALKAEFGIDIPRGTFFMGAEHNTATDELVLFDAEVPASQSLRITLLKSDLKEFQQSAIAERQQKKNGRNIARRKVADWAETRPEWGLAGNAGFIVAPRVLSQNMDLKSRCFLHSYDWELDKKGLYLEMIMQGPMVVTQWINNHYYFSTVDNDRFGGGSKITHNVTGRFGVVSGNGGDLKAGLPLQSVNSSDSVIYHHPIRLSVIIQAPCERIEQILLRNDQLKRLIVNEWIYLLVIDPLGDNQISRYQKDGSWALIDNEEMAASSMLSFNLE